MNVLTKALRLAAALLLGITSSCSRKAEQVAPPPPEVLVTTVMLKDVPVLHEGVATLEGFVTANINAQVQGYIISRDYKEGSLVKKGDLLFQIDPRPFQATLDQAKGNLAIAQANYTKADADVKRAMNLFKQKVISDQERDTYINSANSTKANVQAAEAAVRTAEINLGYTKITAPIDGIVGIATAHVGDLVGPGTGALTTISQVDPIKAAVNVGEQSFTEFLTDHPDADERERYLQGLQFDLLLADGKLYSDKGKFYAEDRNLDTKTGAMRMELSFPNPGNRLRPGQFGKVRAVIKVAKGALVIPEQAVTELQGNRLIAVVDSENKIAMRPVKMGERSGAMWQVIEGVKPGEKVVVQGLLKVRPGSPVTVKEWTPPAEEVTSTNSPPAKNP
ncbi:MAG TPA: efflux RND transporter periplasmic adaptor subunit [Terriglobales bacterium]|nr:efflux RND transporter periplasmic adaptor subunit [Terriglobales bacterium]